MSSSPVLMSSMRTAGEFAEPLHIKLKQQHVAVLDHVFLAFHAVEALFAGGGDRAAVHQVVVGDGFGLDEAALEIAVNDAGGLWRRVAGVDRPGADLLFAGGEVGAQAEQMIDRKSG